MNFTSINVEAGRPRHNPVTGEGEEEVWKGGGKEKRV